jgi:hypothetical protein
MFNVESVRTANAGSALPAGASHITLGFSDVLTRLVFVLCELHRIMREHPKVTPEPFNEADWEFARVAHQFIPIYLDSTLVYLRRLADLMTESARLVLLNDYQSAPRKLEKFRSLGVAGIRKLRPLCDPNALESVLRNHSSWLELLRKVKPGGGFRDALEHRSVQIMTNSQWTEHGPVTHNIVLSTSAPDVDTQQDLIDVLRKAISGFCDLSTGLCSVVQWETMYTPGDWMRCFGRDDDIVGFWPEI